MRSVLSLYETVAKVNSLYIVAARSYDPGGSIALARLQHRRASRQAPLAHPPLDKKKRCLSLVGKDTSRIIVAETGLEPVTFGL